MWKKTLSNQLVIGVPCLQIVSRCGISSRRLLCFSDAVMPIPPIYAVVEIQAYSGFTGLGPTVVIQTETYNLGGKVG